MKKKFVVLISALTLIINAILVASLLLNKSNKIELKNYRITHDEKFGGVYVKITIDDFNNIGFSFGDSVDVSFSSGYSLKDIPYYNGYYTDIEKPLVVGYPNTDYIKVGINNGDDLWTISKLTTNDTVTLTLNKKKKYLDIQNARDIHYSDEQGNMSDEVFTNFRNVEIDDIKENTLYRSASPIDNSHKRASITDKLIKEVGINYIVDLSDNEEEIKEHLTKADFNSPYFKSLYENNKVTSLSLSMQYKSKTFSDSLAKGLTDMANNEGPYLIHCVEGKDRTGFVIMILEALSGASYDEIIDDYMKTYENYYNITLKTDKKKYNIIKEANIDIMIRYISDVDEKTNLKKIDFERSTSKYLLSIGMTQDNIDLLKSKIKK